MNVSTATTAELLAFFNANTGGAQVKKFADRKTAERRVTLLLEEIADEKEIAAWHNGTKGAESEVFGKLTDTRPLAQKIADKASGVNPFIPSYNHKVCPKCGSKEIYNGTTKGGKVVHEDKVAGCHRCDWVQDDRKIARKPVAESLSVAIAKSWQDPSVKAARSERHAVVVNKVQYRSVLQAFTELGLPVNKHIAFRGQLKAAGTLAFQGLVFTVVEAAA